MNLDIAERLAQMRRRRGLSQGELARALGLSRQAVSKWERGESSPDTENLVALADFYGVSLDELVRPGRGAEPKPAADREPTLVEPGQPDDSASADPLAPRSPRRWTRRAAIGLGVAAAFAAGAFLGSGTVPYPGGQLDLKSGIKRLLGYPEIRGRDFNTVGFRNVVLEWPAGTVEFVPTSSFFPLTVEESVLAGEGMRASYKIEDGTLHLWDGDARAWDDPSAGRDLTIWLPMDDAKDERGYDTGGWSFDTLTLDTSTATFKVSRLAGRRLEVILRNGVLDDREDPPEESAPAGHGLDVEELDLAVDEGTAHVRAGSRSFKLALDGGNVFAMLTDGALREGESFRAEATVRRGALAICQPNAAEGCTAHVSLAAPSDVDPDADPARFESSLALERERDSAAPTYRWAGDLGVQTDASPLVRTQDEIVYDVALESGTFGLYASPAWDADADEPNRDLASVIAERR